MRAFISTARAHQRDGGWFHPRNGKPLQVAGEPKDVFCLAAEDADSGNELLCFVVDRTTLEQLEHNIHKVLTTESVRVRRRA